MSEQETWPTGFVDELLSLLDLIDVQEDASLAIQRHEIAEKYGFEVVIGEPLSGRSN
jgi:hypothetical protein